MSCSRRCITTTFLQTLGLIPEHPHQIHPRRLGISNTTMTTPDIPSAQQPEPDPPARPEPGPPKDPDGYVLLIYEPERYIPREPYVDQLDIHILMGPGLRHPLCFRCGQEKNDPEHENPVWHACLNACIHCESDDHVGSIRQYSPLGLSCYTNLYCYSAPAMSPSLLQHLMVEEMEQQDPASSRMSNPPRL